MPNHVTNKIVFPSEFSAKVFALCCPCGKFSFETLIPRPINVYLGDLSSEDERDFSNNWHSWNKENWGTKWGAYSQSCGIRDDDKAFIKFDTAWSVPYPVIAAFANRFKMEFIHSYYDEGECFWGVESWSIKNETAFRKEKRRSIRADLPMILKELRIDDRVEESDT